MKDDISPIPMSEGLFDELKGSEYFCTLELLTGYWQVLMEHPRVMIEHISAHRLNLKTPK